MASYELNLRDYWRVIKHQRIVVILTTIMLGIFTYIFSSIYKPIPIYVASSSIKIENQIPLSALYAQTAYWTRFSDLATHTAELKSFRVLELVAKKIGYIDSTLSSEEIKGDSIAIKRIERLKQLIQTEQEGYTNIINITVRSRYRKEAALVANALAEVYKEENKRRKNAQFYQTRELVTKQLTKARAELAVLEKKVSEFREKYRILDPQITIQNIFKQIETVDEEYRKANLRLEKLQRIKTRLLKDRNYVFDTSLKISLMDISEPLAAMKEEIDNLKNRKEELLKFYTPEYQRVKALTFQIEKKVDQFIAEVSDQEDFLKLTVAALKKKQIELSQRYNELPVVSVQLEKMQRELDTKSQLVSQLELAYQQSQLKEAEIVDDIQIIKQAFIPTSPINPPKITMSTLAGLVIGFVLGLVLAFVVEAFDTSIGAIQELQDIMGVDVIGVIPQFDQEEIIEKIIVNKEEQKKPIPSEELLKMEASLFSHFQPQSGLAEVYRSLRTNIRFTFEREGYKSLIVTSSQAKEGKTTTVVNLAISMAQAHIKTLLIETDLRRPKIHKMFGLEREPGVTDVMLQRSDPNEVIRSWTDILLGSLDTDDIMDSQGLENLYIFTCGRRQQNTAEILSYSYFDEIVEKLRDEYEFLIFDSAPLLQASDGIILGNKCDAALLLYRAGKVPRGALKRSRQQLESLNAELIGIVLNGLRPETTRDYYDYGYKYYGYKSSYYEHRDEALSGQAWEDMDLNEKVAYVIKSPVRWFRKRRFEKKQVDSAETETEEEEEEIFDEEPKGSIVKNLIKGILYTALISAIGLFGYTFFINKPKIQIESEFPLDSLTMQTENQQSVDTDSSVDLQSGIVPDMSLSSEIETPLPDRDNQSSPDYTTITPDNPGSESNLSEIKGTRSFTILLFESTDLNDIKTKLNHLRDLALPAFIAVEYNASSRNYKLCVKNFASYQEAEAYSARLPSFSFSTIKAIQNFPFSIKIYSGSSLLDAIKFQQGLKSLSPFSYIRGNDVFFSAYKSAEDAQSGLNDLKRYGYPAEIVKR